MTDFAKWLLGLIKALFQPIGEFLTDLAISILEGILTALGGIIAALPAPSFATAGIQSTLNAIPGDVWFFASHFQIGACFAVLGAGFSFRMLRKAATLFQW